MISLFITLIIIGVLLWAVNQYVPMDGKIKNIINIVVVICVILYIVNWFGLLSGVNMGPGDWHHGHHW